MVFSLKLKDLSSNWNHRSSEKTVSLFINHWSRNKKSSEGYTTGALGTILILVITGACGIIIRDLFVITLVEGVTIELGCEITVVEGWDIVGEGEDITGEGDDIICAVDIWGFICDDDVIGGEKRGIG